MANQDDRKDQNGASDGLLSSVGNPNPAGPPHEADAPTGVAGTSDDRGLSGGGLIGNAAEYRGTVDSPLRQDGDEDGGANGDDDASRESLREKLSDDAGMINPG